MLTNTLTPIAGRGPGYFLDDQGFDVYSPTIEAEHNARRRLVEWFELDEDLPAPLAPVASRGPAGIFAVPVDGRLPSHHAVAEIKTAVAKIPARYRLPWLAAGGRLEIVFGDDASVHPLAFSRESHHGFCRARESLCVVAGGHPDAKRAALHEIGHLIDYIFEIRERPAWRALWQRERATLSKFSWQHERPSEFWAESFANVWSNNTMFISSDTIHYIAFEAVPT